MATYRPSSFSFDVFVVFIHLPWVLKLKITRKLSNEIVNYQLLIIIESFGAHSTFNLVTEHEKKIMNSQFVKYPRIILLKKVQVKYVLINLTVSTNCFQVNIMTSYSLRKQRTFIHPKCKTERCKNNFVLSYVYSSWELDIILFLIVYRNLTHAFEFGILWQF